MLLVSVSNVEINFNHLSFLPQEKQKMVITPNYLALPTSSLILTKNWYFKILKVRAGNWLQLLQLTCHYFTAEIILLQ